LTDEHSSNQTPLADAGARARRRRGLLFAVGAAAAVALNAVIAKWVMEVLHPLTFVPFWHGTACLYSTAYLLIRRMPVRPQLRRHWKPMLGIGLFHGLGAAAGFAGLHLLDPTVANFFVRTGILFTWLLGVVVLGERPDRPAIGGMLLAVVGIAVLSYATGAAHAKGIALSLTAAIVGAFGFLLGKYVAGSTSTAVTVWMRSGTIALLVLVLALATGTFRPVLSWPHLLVLALGAAVGPFGSQLLFFYSLKYIALSEASVVRALSPVFVAVYYLAFLGMFPAPKQLIGGAIVLAGLVLLARAQPTSQRPPSHDTVAG
jgi:drug/metabolite transporter (DMT)-like permease